jgi:outer membrane protein OmpU
MDDDVTGNPIGIGSNYTLSGSGDLDNGWTVGYDIAILNKHQYSSTNVSVTIPALGAFRISSGVSGSGIDRMDDVTPNVWEEAYATGLSTGVNTVGGVSGSSNIEYTPNMLPDGLTARVAYSPDASGGTNNDKASSGGAANQGSGYDLTIVATDAMTGMSGLTIGAGMSNVKQEGGTNVNDDREERTMYATYAIGGFTVGYQWSEEDLGTSASEQEYTNDGYGITFAVNDDLSIGYNYYESEQTSTTNVTNETESYQIAYSMGGASIRLAEGRSDNQDYNTGANYDKDNTVLSISLAF